jgi:Asp/Glu/hydantoin racemase
VSAPLGVLMLDTHFPRVPGDVGNAATWPFPVRYRTVQGAIGTEVVRDLRPERLLEPFVDAALELEQAGASLITTSCGFLVLFQQELQAHLRVPILASSMLQVPWLLALLPPARQVGVLTIEGRSLSPRHLAAAGIADPERVPIVGLDEAGGYFTGQILGDQAELDVERAAEEHEIATHLLLERHPYISAVVLECTNMPPYAERIRAASGLPVYDLTTLIGWAMGGFR